MQIKKLALKISTALFFVVAAIACNKYLFFTNKQINTQSSIKKSPNTAEKNYAFYQKIIKDTASMSFQAFEKGLDGYQKLLKEGKLNNPDIATFIDFSKPSTAKRMFVLNLRKKKLLLQTYVAHGRNSGDNFADKFSNKNGSLQSSLGFYLVKESYIGKYGKSLILEGIEKNINHLARERAIVMHPADYVSEAFIRQSGRLGRSWGCPAFPIEHGEKLVKLLKGNSCLFIYHPDYEKIEAKLI